MKIGNIKNLVKNIASEYRERISMQGNSIHRNFMHDIQELPKECLNDFFQKRFNKNVDYDQWAGIREELERMGRELYGRSLTVLGDALFLIQGDNERKIANLESELKSEQEAHAATKKELKKYID